MTHKPSHEFELYDLKVEVIQGKKKMACSHTVGDFFEVQGENIIFSAGQAFSLYALASLLPLLPAKQRQTDRFDWMTTDEYVACPDPHCGGLFKITRMKTRTFRHSDVSADSLT
jgi:uncharacterized repeat protein (TIGR04076 family)